MAKVKNRPLCHCLGSQLVFETALVVVLQKKSSPPSRHTCKQNENFFPYIILKLVGLYHLPQVT